VRLDENECRGVLRAQLPQDGRKLLELLSLARIDQQGRPLNFTAALHVQFAERGDQGDGKIVDAVETEVFNVLRTVLFPEPLSPVRITSCRASRADRRFTGLAYAFTRRWCVLGMRRSSRILQRFFV